MARPEAFDRIERAILRRPAKNMAEGMAPGAVGIPDYERARLQHIALTEALKSCGVAVTALPADVQFPEGSKVADMAVVTDKLAVLSNLRVQDPRQGEQQAAASVLAGCRFMKFISAPGVFDAGDVLRLGDRFYITLSARTNEEGASQLAFFLKEFGYEAEVIRLEEADSLRLGSAAVYLGADRILIREEIAQHYAFLEYEKTLIRNRDRDAAAALMVNGTLLLPQGFPDLRADLRLMDIPVIEVNVSEFEKTGSALSSLVIALPEAAKGNVVLMQGWQKQGAA